MADTDALAEHGGCKARSGSLVAGGEKLKAHHCPSCLVAHARFSAAVSELENS